MKLSLQVLGEPHTTKSDVVLIHGTGSSSEMWKAQVDMLTKSGHRCFLLDLRGHGGTHEPGEPTDLDVHVDDVIETLEHGGIRYPAAFLGHSLGSIISLTIAKRRPEMAETLLLAALPGRVHAPIASIFKIFLNGPFHAIRDSKIHHKMAWREKTLFSTPHFSLDQIVQNFDKVDLVEEAHPVQCPVHLSAGRFDPVAPVQHIEKIHRSMPDSTLKVWDLAGHNFMDYNKESFNQWILEKLAERKEKAEHSAE